MILCKEEKRERERVLILNMPTAAKPQLLLSLINMIHVI